MDICIICGAIAVSNARRIRCKNGHGDMLHLGKCGGCGVELGYVIDDDLFEPEQLACGDCVKRAMRRSKT